MWVDVIGRLTLKSRFGCISLIIAGDSVYIMLHFLEGMIIRYIKIFARIFEWKYKLYKSRPFNASELQWKLGENGILKTELQWKSQPK